MVEPSEQLQLVFDKAVDVAKSIVKESKKKNKGYKVYHFDDILKIV